ncbi:heterokaryon incompatibility protein-domain-containing protein, partial [Leptodontidium sp. 2 PMI_412]
MIRSWLGKCRIEHPLCHQSNRLWSPTRLLDLGTGDMSDMKLCNRPSNSEPYIALSYCWGPPSGVIQTTKATIAHRKVSISYANLPVLFRDAIELTRALGIRFLWIDSLCIIQDDIEDWERESSVMAEVYSNSYLTIAATASTSPHTGLFGKRWTSTPLAPGESPGLRISRFWDVDNSAAHLHDAPLLSRAWAFQERLLAPYTLHFHAEELVWECRSGVQCECGTLVNSDNSSANPFAKINAGYLKTRFSLATEAIEKVWLSLVSEFCQLRLTYERDRLPALSGLASKLGGQVLGKYFAGVW